ncbi:MAG: hypothetical protein JXB03_03350 [Spirochaetales bacterium]|nr:hypothetical protein [Spirochaetales bacterium]
MSVQKIIAIICIFAATAVAWMILGAGTSSRTDSSFTSLKDEVASLYGGEMIISTPACYSRRTRTVEEVIDGKTVQRNYSEEVPFDLTASAIHIMVNNDQRKKGNLWFPTFTTDYRAEYIFTVREQDISEGVFISASLESENAIYDAVGVEVNGREYEDIAFLIRREEIQVVPDDDGRIRLSLEYHATGMDTLYYFISRHAQIAQVQDFTCVIETDFFDIDFPTGMMSPSVKTRTDSGYRLEWRFENAVTGKDIGLVIPSKLKPGEIVTRVTYFAPVSLLFFFAVLLVISAVARFRPHPVHFAFLAATFFSFHLMYSYFSDHLNLYLTFGISSFVSLTLTITYLRLFAPPLIAYVWAPLTQFLYLVVFSFSFFFDGITGVIVTICSVLTLFTMMQITGRMNWDAVFGSGGIREEPMR